MAKKKPTESALTNVLDTAIELLQDTENAEDDGMITVNNGVYLRLRAAVKKATGVAEGIAVKRRAKPENNLHQRRRYDRWERVSWWTKTALFGIMEKPLASGASTDQPLPINNRTRTK